MKKITTFIGALLLLSSGYAQTPNSVFLEVGGYTRIYSVNYARQIAQVGNRAFFFRGGLGFDGTEVSIPLAGTFTMNFSGHHLLLGAGATMVRRRKTEWTIAGSDTYIYYTTEVGYRFRLPGKPWFLGASLYPKFKTDPEPGNFLPNERKYLMSIGAHAGYSF
ncbi:MAG: hypothetical protein AAGI38_15270 [Bacteroidota bacterium]